MIERFRLFLFGTLMVRVLAENPLNPAAIRLGEGVYIVRAQYQERAMYRARLPWFYWREAEVVLAPTKPIPLPDSQLAFFTFRVSPNDPAPLASALLGLYDFIEAARKTGEAPPPLWPDIAEL